MYDWVVGFDNFLSIFSLTVYCLIFLTWPLSGWSLCISSTALKKLPSTVSPDKKFTYSCGIEKRTVNTNIFNHLHQCCKEVYTSNTFIASHWPKFHAALAAKGAIFRLTDKSVQKKKKKRSWRPFLFFQKEVLVWHRYQCFQIARELEIDEIASPIQPES